MFATVAKYNHRPTTNTPFTTRPLFLFQTQPPTSATLVPRSNLRERKIDAAEDKAENSEDDMLVVMTTTTKVHGTKRLP